MFETNHLDSPEASLWKAVLIRAIYDMQIDRWAYEKSLNGVRGRLWKRLELNLSEAQSVWCESICLLVGRSHEQYVDVMRAIMNGEYEIKIPRYSNFDHLR